MLIIMDDKWRRCVQTQILHLLKRDHKPRVQVHKSNIEGAGSGVFSKQRIECTDDTKKPTVICLYPGIFTPGLPLHATSPHSTAQYLANQVPPSFQQGEGPCMMHENAYIMNLQKCGGYIDGKSLNSQYNDHKLDDNQSACAHLVNHHANDHNTMVYSFAWKEMLEHDFNTEEYNARDGDEDHYPLPNEVRSDGKLL